jgi:LuxR family transcriptional regulator, maltose regulon positive regulatory protein
VISFDGQDRLVADYVESEFLDRISARQRVFLTRTAVLERMSGPLCDAVLDLPGSAATLAELARSNMLLVPLDRHGQWYRYHHLFRDMLLADLERQAPGLVPVLRRRAAAWYLANDLSEEALEYAMAAGDTDTAAHLVERLAVPARRQGRTATLQRWFGWLEERGGVERYPMVTVLAALIYAWMGRPAEADRWADMVDRWRSESPGRPGTAAVRAWAALARAMLCRHGVEQMLADADEAARRFAAEHVVTAGPAFLQGIARLLSGDPDGGDAYLQEAVSLGEKTGAHEIAAAALTERSLIAMARGQWDRAGALAGQAPTALGRAGDSYVTPLICAAQARAAAHRGDLAAVHEQLVTARRLRPLQTYAVPHVAVQAHLELIRVHLALADLAGARTLMREVDELLTRRPGLGTLAGEASALRARLAAERGSAVRGASALTTAELRLLPHLATHLSVPEIAAELFLSPHTIKSQLRSVYRKLDASTRSQAVTRGRELGLLEG